jgi:hypothetical protein
MLEVSPTQDFPIWIKVADPGAVAPFRLTWMEKKNV